MSATPTVVLMHGLFGFRQALRWEYFRGVRPLLEGMGLRVHIPVTPSLATIRRQAESLARQLRDEPHPVHIVGHSMGGLVARDYITHLGGHARVHTLTTLSTPHAGSSLAEYVEKGLTPLRFVPAISDLTPLALQHFNRDTPDQPDVRYYSYSAARPVHDQPLIVRGYGRIVERAEGANDNMVSALSGCWGSHIRQLLADHYELIGLNLWMNPLRQRPSFDHLALYREIGERILESRA